jgi:hypothetical protein
MSFIDSICVFMDNDALTDAQEAQNADHFLDLETYGEIDKMIGPVYWNTMIGTAGTAGVGMYLKLITSDSADFSSPVVVASIGDAADPAGFADWPAGKAWSIQIPTKKLLKYLGVEFVETTNAADLTVDSWLGMEPISEQNLQKEPT